MYFLEISGYGYSRSVCQNVTYWFLNKYLPRKKINLEILHRGLKREKVCGYCDVSSKSYKPRNFLIELDNFYLYKKNLLEKANQIQILNQYKFELVLEVQVVKI